MNFSRFGLMRPLYRRSTVGFLFLLFFTAACGETSTQPEMADDFGPSFALFGGSAWSASGPGAVTLNSDGVSTDPSMSYHLTGGAVFSPQTWSFSNMATEAGSVTLPYQYSGFHAYFQVRVWLEAFVTNGSGTTTYPLINDGPVNCCTSPSAGFSYSGSVTLNLQPGDQFGFRFGGQNFDSNSQLRGTFTIDLHPETKDQCKKGGWEQYGFKNQGQCVRFIETGKDSR